MSDSEASINIPPDSKIERAIRTAVAKLYKLDSDNVTLKLVRKEAEDSLGLTGDFLKSDPKWKDRSKDIIHDEVAKQDAIPSSQPVPHDGDENSEQALTPRPKAKATKPADGPAPQKRGTKRASPEVQLPARKRAKKTVADTEESDSDLDESKDSSLSDVPSEVDSEPAKPVKKAPQRKPRKVTSEGRKPTAPVKKAKGAPARKRKSETVDSEAEGEEEAHSPVLPPPKNGEEVESELSELDDAPPPKTKKTRSPVKRAASAEVADSEGDVPNPEPISKKSKPVAGDDSSSELSSLIDEAPPAKKRASKSAEPKFKSKSKASKSFKPAKATSKAKPEPSDPNEAEIKRLQGYLLKCGIRKLWHRELAPYTTSSAKINHLKKMLKDVGMDGRFSAEKARQIKEQRELLADLEAVQEGARRWGQDSDGEEEEGADGEGGSKGQKRKKGSVEADEAEEDEDEDGSPRKGRRVLARGFRDLAFLGDDGEETD